jgi:hypothetical protein
MACYNNQHVRHYCNNCRHFAIDGKVCKYIKQCMDARLENRPGKCYWRPIKIGG